jgi:hypothetical protein
MTGKEQLGGKICQQEDDQDQIYRFCDRLCELRIGRVTSASMAGAPRMLMDTVSGLDRGSVCYFTQRILYVFDVQ